MTRLLIEITEERRTTNEQVRSDPQGFTNFIKLPDANKRIPTEELAGIGPTQGIAKSRRGVNNYLRWLMTFLGQLSSQEK
jgi:hypothetical protein